MARQINAKYFDVVASQVFGGTRYDYIIVPERGPTGREGYRVYMSVNYNDFEDAHLGWYEDITLALESLARHLYDGIDTADETKVHHPTVEAYYNKLVRYYEEERRREEEKRRKEEEEAAQAERERRAYEKHKAYLLDQIKKVKFYRFRTRIPLKGQGSEEEEEVEVIAYTSPSTPGLIIHPSVRVKNKRAYAITHTHSMLAGADWIPTLEMAKIVAWRWSQLTNWDVPKEQLPLEELASVAREIVVDPFVILD